jgi:hypothetical protein
MLSANISFATVRLMYLEAGARNEAAQNDTPCQSFQNS